MQQLERSKNFVSDRLAQVNTTLRHTLSTPEMIESRRRFMTEQISRPGVWPHEIIEIRENGVEHAAALMDEGYGVIVYFNHFSMRDPLDVMLALAKENDRFMTAPITAPLAYHHSKKPLVSFVDKFDISLMPMVTPDTEEKGKDVTRPGIRERAGYTLSKTRARILRRELPQHPKRELEPREKLNLWKDYLQSASETLSGGGLVYIAPEAGRRDRLTEFEGRPIKRLVKTAAEHGATKLAFLPVAVIDTETPEYHKSGINRGHTYALTVGPCLTLEEANTQTEYAAGEPLTDRQKLDGIDTTLYHNLRALFPEGHAALRQAA